MWNLWFSHFCWWRLKLFVMSYCVRSWELCHFGAACCLHLQGLAAVFFTAKSMKMETAHYSKMSVPIYQTTWLNIREKRTFSFVDIFPHFTENTKHCICDNWYEHMDIQQYFTHNWYPSVISDQLEWSPKKQSPTYVALCFCSMLLT